MAGELLKLLTLEKDARLFVVDVTEPLRERRSPEVTAETETAQSLYKKVFTNCALMRGMLADEQRLSVNLRFRGEGYSVHGEVDGRGHVHCVLSAKMRAFDGDLADLVGEGATLSITRGSWTGGMFTGTIELSTPDVDRFFSQFYCQSEQLETVFVSWTDEEPARGCMIQPLPCASGGRFQELVTQVRDLAPRLWAAKWNEIASLLAPLARVVERFPVRSQCQCSKEALWGMLMALEREELERLVAQDKELEIECGVCGRKYVYGAGDLERVLRLKQGAM